MTFELHRTDLAGDTPGASTKLNWYTAGPADAATRIHLQAALHADEQPGTMALHHLLPMLRDADAAGQLNVHFTIFPSVNPLGLANYALRHHIGRYDIETGINYNRRWPDLYPLIAPSIAGRLGPSSPARRSSNYACWSSDLRPLPISCSTCIVTTTASSTSSPRPN